MGEEKTAGRIAMEAVIAECEERKERRVGNLLAFGIIVGYAMLAVVTWVLFSYDNPGELIIGCALVFGIILGMYGLQLFRWMDEFKKNMKVE